MTDLAMERLHLVESDRHIAQAELIVARQMALVEATRLVRLDVRAEEHTLKLFEPAGGSRIRGLRPNG